jgi:hypothetical protein
MQIETAMHPKHWQDTATAMQEQRDPDTQYSNRRSEALDTIGNIASLRWDTEGSSSSSIWSARQEESSSFQSSYGSMGSSGGVQPPQGLLGVEPDLISGMNDLSFHHHNASQPPRLSSLQMAANRFTTTTAIAPSGSASVTSTGTSIPGLMNAFSGSVSQYSSSHYNPPQKNVRTAPTMLTGPPPGFLSPITTSNQRQSSAGSDDLDTSTGSLGTSSSFHSQRSRHQQRSTHRSRGATSGRQPPQRGGGGGFSINSAMMNDSIATQDTNDLQPLQRGTYKQQQQQLLGDNTNDSSLQSALSMASSKTPLMSGVERPILPQPINSMNNNWDVPDDSDDEEDLDPRAKKLDWLLRMNRRLTEIPVGDLDTQVVPLLAIMNSWAKTKSSQGATMVEMWLNRAQQEYEAGNRKIYLTTKMYTMAGTNLLVFYR